MRLLALDTATEALSVALLTEHGLICESQEIGRGHAQEILKMVDRVLAAGEVKLTDLSGIAAGVGPGSFTGVRVSVAVAQGLALGADLPVIAITSLETLAVEAFGRGAERVIACLDARMGEVYWGSFETRAEGVLEVFAPPSVGAPGSVRWPDPVAAPGRDPVYGIGRGFSAYPELLQLPGVVVDAENARALPQARYMLELAAARLEAGGGIDPALLEPLYVRDKVARTEKERGVGQNVAPNVVK